HGGEVRAGEVGARLAVAIDVAAHTDPPEGSRRAGVIASARVEGARQGEALPAHDADVASFPFDRVAGAIEGRGDVVLAAEEAGAKAPVEQREAHRGRLARLVEVEGGAHERERAEVAALAEPGDEPVGIVEARGGRTTRALTKRGPAR